MAKPYILKELEKNKGRPLEEVIPPLVNELGSAKAAAEQLGVSPSTITVWLNDAGYRRITQYVKYGTKAG